jgi:hypothetical protein
MYTKGCITKLLFCWMAFSSVKSYAAQDLFDVLKQAQTSKNLSIGDVGGNMQGMPDINSPEVQAQLQAMGNPRNAQSNNATSQNVASAMPVSIREEAFGQLLNKRFPLSPEQTKELHLEYSKNLATVNASATVPPQPVSSTVKVDLSPGANLPVVRPY